MDIKTQVTNCIYEALREMIEESSRPDIDHYVYQLTVSIINDKISLDDVIDIIKNQNDYKLSKNYIPSNKVLS